ncbi:chemotaxis protein CheA [Roseococcus suduntuyensis]|uniref:Chemotaxis protein CheA n=1 Tax=Roseococcus suduntuyensis TaxID=455361 RepID=A0A840ACY3_9PROT|nr:ATP-binding protein [Roseococcus suduntuyensis]MBB3898782.1 two-component system chemotaxis sensor kinase CheA [Roseococcus suduntuyensis]
MEADDPLWQEFAAETAEHLDTLELGLDGSAPVDVLFRAMHSLKGMSAALGAQGMGALAHRAEDVLGLVRAGRMALDAPARDALLAAVDALRVQRAALLERQADAPPPPELLARLAALAEGRPEAAHPAISAAPVAGASPLRLSLAARLAQEVPTLARGEALPGLAEAAEGAGLPRLAMLLRAAPGSAAAFGRLRAALLLLEANTGLPAGAAIAWPDPPDPDPLRAATEAELAEAARDYADAALAYGMEGAETLGRQVQDLALRGLPRPAGLEAALTAGRPLEGALAPPPPPLTPGLAAVLPPSAHARAAAAMAGGQRIWRLRLGPLAAAESLAAPFLARTGEVLASAGPPEAMDIFLASALPAGEIAALRAETDPEGVALAHLAPADAPPPAPTMRVRQDRIDAVIALETELRSASLALTEALAAPEARAALAELGALQGRLPPAFAARIAGPLERLRAATGAAERAASRVSLTLGQLDEAVLALRVVPFATLATRLPRALRAAAEAGGKQAALVVEGEDVQLDRALADALADPLLHLIRNAADHGVEPPAERMSAGKPATAQLVLSAERLPGRLRVSLADDGRGIDEALVLARAVDRGLLSPDAAARLAPADIHALLFLPGFSTREAVSETSGRGVGLDVVQEAARRAGGVVRVESTQGQGTRFTLDVPLNAAIQPVLLVEAGGHSYALPAGRVEAVLRPEECAADAAPLALETVLRLPPARPGAVVVLRRPGGRLSLAVARLGRRTDLLLKPLHPELAATPGVGGVGVLGNGEAVLLLEPDGL